MYSPSKGTALFLCGLFLLALSFFFGHSTRAQQFNSTNYKVNDPVLFTGGYATSSSFRLNSVVGQLGIGTSSASTWKINSGFLYFPTVTTPVVSVTPGDGQISLSWTTATGYLGWSVTTYSVGRSTTSGTGYSFTNVGNVTSATQSGLTNNTTYYFVIRVNDTFGNVIATSTQVSGTPVATTPPPVVPPPPTGGGDPPPPSVITAAIFRGRAYPGSEVTLLKDGVLAARQPAGPDARFDITITGLTAGTFNFGVYSEDKRGNRSVIQTFPITVALGATTVVSGIFLAPTIDVDKSEVKKGDNIAIFGQSTPDAKVTIEVNSDQQVFVNTDADRDGVYLYNFDTAPLELGDHTAKSKAAIVGEISPFGKLVGFKVGNQNVIIGPKKCPGKGDVNSDCRVNLIDFSITAYWYRRTLSAGFLAIEKDKLSGDGKITLTDFSIMAYYWTG